MSRSIGGLDWDDGNREKCQKHGVSLEEIERFFGHTFFVVPDPAHSADEVRFKAIGTSGGGRHVLVVFTLRERAGQIVVRPISARYMHAKEVQHYERTKTQIEKAADTSDG